MRYKARFDIVKKTDALEHLIATFYEGQPSRFKEPFNLQIATMEFKSWLENSGTDPSEAFLKTSFEESYPVVNVRITSKTRPTTPMYLPFTEESAAEKFINNQGYKLESFTFEKETIHLTKKEKQNTKWQS